MLNDYLAYFQRTHPREIDLSLGRMMQIIDDLGNPHHSFPPVIHVAGTNGKGSTIAFMRAILEAAGLSVNAYTSPHLIRFNERIILRGTPIQDHLLCHYLDRIQQVNNGQPLTFFEGTTAAAFLAFADHPADVILLETGLGGRLDATNIIPNPTVCVITPISYDHMDFLGSTIEEITHEKAGIIKPNAQVILAQQEHPIVNQIIDKKARTVGASIVPCPPLSKDMPLGIVGIYQYINARAAIGAISALQSQVHQAVTCTSDIMLKGLQQAHWPGRMQHISQTPDIWLEGAHNEAGFQQLHQQLKQWRMRDDRPIHIGIALLKNRDPAMVFHYLNGLVDKIYAIDCQEINDKRSNTPYLRFHSPQEFVKLYSKDAHDGYQIECEVLSEKDTLKKMMTESTNNPRNIITGSLYLIGKVLTLLENVNE